jgi:hypothetical protein
MKTKHKSKKKHLNCFEDFTNDADVVFLSRTLRDMLLDYVVFNKEALPIDVDLSIYQLLLLFKLLDKIEDENQKNTT